jgi:hypothetical protein
MPPSVQTPHKHLWIKHCQGVVDWELLTKPDMAGLFPGGTIHIERAPGLSKSIVAWRRRPS